MEQFCRKQKELLEIENDSVMKESEELLSSVSLAELQRRGIVLTKIRSTSMRTGLGGKSLVDFEATEQGNVLPTHGFRTGDIVSVSANKKGESKDEVDFFI